jgi:hypothetical protein
MSFDMLLREVESLPEAQRRKLLAFIVALEDRADANYAAKLAQKIDDKDPARWLSVEECARELGLPDESR